jgi:hypothetical protein
MLNSFLEQWTTDDPDNYTVTTEDATNKITENTDGTGGGIFQSDNTNEIWISQSVMTATTVYRYKIVLTSITSGTVYLYENGNSVASFTVAGTYTGTFTATGTDAELGCTTAGTVADGLVKEFSIKEEVAGTECYNTFPTCRDPENFDKTTIDLKFTSNNAEIPFAGVRPYVQNVGVLPTKIDQEITVKSRLKITMLDELSDDIFLDPYISTRTSNQGEFWKKLLARNPNYKGRPVKVYDGYVGEPENEFEQRWQGQLENITINRGQVTLDSIDELVNLENTTVPEKNSAKLVNNITSSQLTIVLDTILKDDGVQIDSSGYMRVDDEIIYYTSLTAASNQLNLPSDGRGYFETTAASHNQGDRATIVKYFAPQVPFDQLRDLWDLSGGDYTADFDSSWDDFEDYPAPDLNFSAIITENDALTASDLFWEIAKIIDLHIWQDENQKIAVRRNLGNDPNRTYKNITDTANVIERSMSSDLNEIERKTRSIMYWGKSTLAELEDVTGYSEVDVAVDSDAESANGFNDVIQEIIFNRWVSKRFLNAEDSENYVSALVGRRLLNRRDARPIVNLNVELKDEGILTGDSARLDTDELLNPDGTNITESFIVMKREKQQGILKLSLKEMPKQRIGFIAPANHPDYEDATDDEKEYGYVSTANGIMPNRDPGYHIW